MLQDELTIKSAESINSLALIVDNLNPDSITHEITSIIQETLTNLTEERLYKLKNESDSKIMTVNLSELENFIKSECKNLQDEIKTVITDDYVLLNRVNSRADELILSVSGNLQRMIQQVKGAQNLSSLEQFGQAKNIELSSAVSESFIRIVNERLSKFQQDIDSLISERKFNEAEEKINFESTQLLRDITSVRGDGNLLSKVRDTATNLTEKLKKARPSSGGKFFAFILFLAVILGGAWFYDNYYNDGKIFEEVRNFINNKIESVK